MNWYRDGGTLLNANEPPASVTVEYAIPDAGIGLASPSRPASSRRSRPHARPTTSQAAAARAPRPRVEPQLGAVAALPRREMFAFWRRCRRWRDQRHIVQNGGRDRRRGDVLGQRHRRHEDRTASTPPARARRDRERSAIRDCGTCSASQRFSFRVSRHWRRPGPRPSRDPR